jgi:hypothetical protein
VRTPTRIERTSKVALALLPFALCSSAKTNGLTSTLAILSRTPTPLKLRTDPNRAAGRVADARNGKAPD